MSVKESAWTARMYLHREQSLAMEPKSHNPAVNFVDYFVNLIILLVAVHML